MKTKFELLLMSLLLLASLASAGKWTIDSFDDSPDPGEEDSYIAKESGSGLTPVNPSQVVQQANRLYVRQKFEDPFGDEEATYQIYQGKPKDAANNLGRISLDGIQYTTLLKMKLFYTKNAKGDDDLETVYFDGKDIFVEGEDPIYINLNGKMEELKPIVARDYKISITSDPTDANVAIGNAEKGKTPITFSVPSSKPITVVISKDGYYTVIKPITPSDKQTVQEGILLTAKKGLDNPAAAFKAKLQTAVANKDGSAIKGIKTDVQKVLSTYNTDAKKTIDATMSKFPANPPKTQSESSSDFSARQSLWNAAQSKEKDALNKDAQNYFNELKDLLVEIDAAIGEMEFALKYEYIPNSAITFSNMGVRDFTIDVNVSNPRVKFNAKSSKVAYGTIPRNQLTQNEENVHGVLKIWDTPNENGEYTSIYNMEIFYDETPLALLSKGTFTLPQATASSRNTEKDLNTRIAKYSGKANWDKKDSDATIATLRLGEIPGASTMAKAAAPSNDDAYYDEDEDDDEFDDEMDEQDEQDYSRYSAAKSASDVFGSSDEYLFWAGMVFAAAAIGTGVVGFLENRKWQDANDKVEAVNKYKTDTENLILSACGGSAACQKQWVDYLNQPIDKIDPEIVAAIGVTDANIFHTLNTYKKQNEEVRDSYNKSRIIWFSAAGLSAAISITLFAW